MDELFDQLKSSAGPIKSNKSPAKTSNTIKSSKPPKSADTSKHITTADDFNKKHNSNPSSIRRESLPSPPTFGGSGATKKLKNQKARSLSPPKHAANTSIRSLKVKLERKKIEEFLSRPLEEHANNIRAKQNKNMEPKQAKKSTPTKAQQKLFEPLKQKKTNAQILKDFKIKPCKVRIRRDNLEKLSKEFKDNHAVKSAKGTKRSATSSLSSQPPAKKGKPSGADTKAAKPKNNFFIKLASSPSSKMEKKLKNITKFSSSSSSSSSSVAHHNKIRNSKSSTSVTTPTKFSRSQLIGSFGKRFFNVQVKIERCTHPLMLTFESNDRARRLQAKRNKSKNLSVSFREQVEIFGGSSDSDDSYDEDFCAVPNRNIRKSNSNQSVPVSVTPVVMPARLKKVENGKVVDDIELDPSLFVDPKSLVASTPFSPLRKKRDHKSFSPLKDECSPSPRKEQLKLANERVPPSGLRRLNIDEEDDEDDDCEYIVPIELPQRRSSRTSSNGSLDDIISSSIPLEDSATDFTSLFNNDNYHPDSSAIDINLNANKKDEKNVENLTSKESYIPPSEINHESGSNDSFKSANDDILEKDSGNVALEKIDDNLLPAMGLSVTPPNLELVDSEKAKTNGDCSVAEAIEKKQNAEVKSKHLNTMDTMDDISINLFLEDSQTNDDNQTKSIVDSLINETIDKLTKEIDENGAEKQFTDKL